jgi:hypothetical protein
MDERVSGAFNNQKRNARSQGADEVKAFEDYALGHPEVIEIINNIGNISKEQANRALISLIFKIFGVEYLVRTVAIKKQCNWCFLEIEKRSPVYALSTPAIFRTAKFHKITDARTSMVIHPECIGPAIESLNHENYKDYYSILKMHETHDETLKKNVRSIERYNVQRNRRN